MEGRLLGDGGPAVRAELSSVSDLSFAPDGALYVADGGRVRVIGRNGVIRTIAGDGRQSKAVANGTPRSRAARVNEFDGCQRRWAVDRV